LKVKPKDLWPWIPFYGVPKRIRKGGKMATFSNRILRAAKLEISLYEEVEADKQALGQALGVVVLSSLAAGIGMITRIGPWGMLIGLISALAGWLIWAYLTYWIGAKLFPEPQTQADPGEMLRVIGFASSPGLIRFLGIIPGATGVVFFVASVWSLVAMVLAVRQALDYQSTWRAIGVCLAGWILQALILVLFLKI
jgi:hypothetical protein